MRYLNRYSEWDLGFLNYRERDSARYFPIFSPGRVRRPNAICASNAKSGVEPSLLSGSAHSQDSRIGEPADLGIFQKFGSGAYRSSRSKPHHRNKPRSPRGRHPIAKRPCQPRVATPRIPSRSCLAPNVRERFGVAPRHSILVKPFSRLAGTQGLILSRSVG